MPTARTYLNSDELLRQEALRLADDSRRAEQPDTVVKRAQLYYEFLSNKESS